MVLPVFLLSACLGGGGSFDLDSVETKQHNPQSEAPKYQDEQTEKPAKPDEAQAAENDRPAYGFAVKIPRRNVHQEVKQKHQQLSDADWVKLAAGKPDEFPQKNEISAMNKGTLNESIQPGEDGKSRVEGYTGFQYVRSGYIYRNGANKIDFKNKIVLFGPDGYLFYKGSNPSQALPTGKAIYKGTWDYVTDAKEKQKFSQLGNSQAGDRYGALSAEEADVLRNKSEAKEGQTDFGLTSEFEVDFAAKTMTGKLYRNNRITNNETENRDKQIKRYDIQANLHGNRFKGKAVAADRDATNGSHPFISDSDSLEGGFYGPKGEELAGKFLSKDNKVAAVFGAKQKDKKEGENAAGLATETVIDAYRITGGEFKKEQIDSFGDVKKLLVDGVELSLPSEGNKAAFQHGIEQNGVKATVCCSNLDYMSFGKLSKENKDDMFLQGVRTPVSDVAARTEANAKYRGTWYGYIANGTSWSGEASNQEGGNRAEFDVDFSTKNISGTLTAKNRTSPAFTITATIQGNGFSGTARTGENGFALDPKNTINPVYTHIQADVSGGFYGKNAIEMGGSFSFPGNAPEGKQEKASVVFGAKRQQLVQ